MAHCMTDYPSRRSYIEIVQNFMCDQEEDEDGPQKLLTMKDQEQMLQELKKENFDLKLRLYMTEKNSETAEGKVSEYEQQLAALLNNLEEQQCLSDKQSKELKEAIDRENKLLTKQKRLEATCHEQDEKIHNLSLSLNQLSASMHDVSSAKHSTPLRGTRSAYIPADDSMEDDSAVQPYQSNVSHVTPMRRDAASTSSYAEESSSAGLVSHDRGVHHSVSETTHYNTTSPVTKNYFNSGLDDKHARNEGHGNVGVVRPNNTRTVVDVELPENSHGPAETPKKKKKGFMNVFKLCTGKSKETHSRESMYTKPEPARITMTTYNN